MTKNIVIINGNPKKKSFSQAIAKSYKDGAVENGFKVSVIEVQKMKFDPILHFGYEKQQKAEPDIKAAQKKIKEADHMVIIFPLWAFSLPALLKGFFERVFQRGFAYEFSDGVMPKQLLKGKTVRVIMTMGMPSLIYATLYGAHCFKSLKCILKFCGIKVKCPVFFGKVETSNKRRTKFLQKVYNMGACGK